MRFIAGLLLLVAVTTTATAETAYVTDSLRLGLHRAEDTSDRAFRTLESGQELEVLASDRNYAQVRLPDGTVGYVKAAYLVNEKPAKLVVDETLAENEDLKTRLAELNAAFSQPAATIASLEETIAAQEAALEEQTELAASLQEQVDDLRDRQAAYKYSLPLNWVAGALGLFLLGGFLGGLWWTDYRSRRRHGGIRIY